MPKKNNPIKLVSTPQLSGVNGSRAQAFCRGCGKRIRLSLFKYCPDCVNLARRLEHEPFSVKIKKDFWAYIRKHGLRCSYTGIFLDLKDKTSPWYLIFSRLNSRVKPKILPVSALVNAMKGRLQKNEFWYYVLALDDHRKKYLKVKKIPLVNWRGPRPSIGDQVCTGCERAAALKGHMHCARCARIAYRMKKERFPREAINEVWSYIRKYGFVCYYTGMELDMDNPQSPWYLVFDHWKPRDPRKIVITSSLINRMKTDLTEKEFWYFIGQLANFHKFGTTFRKMKLAYWSRPYR